MKSWVWLRLLRWYFSLNSNLWFQLFDQSCRKTRKLEAVSIAVLLSPSRKNEVGLIILRMSSLIWLKMFWSQGSIHRPATASSSVFTSIPPARRRQVVRDTPPNILQRSSSGLNFANEDGKYNIRTVNLNIWKKVDFFVCFRFFHDIRVKLTE